MKKLMLTSALAGLALTASAMAQTTISGEIRVSLKAIGSETDAAADTRTSGRGFGTEQQINFANKGKLNVGGLDYAAGFSIENDGTQGTTLFNENSYIDITNASSGTTLSFSVDHIQRNDSDRSAGNIFGFAPSEYSSSGHGNSLLNATPGPAVGQSQSVAVIQDIGKFGKLAYNYAPTTTDKGAATNTGTGNSEAFAETNEESAYEISFVGDLGVSGLTVDAFKSKQKAVKTAAGVENDIQAEGQNIGVRYNTGALTFGVARKKWNDEALNEAAKVEITEKNYAIAYAVDKNITLGLLHATGKSTAAAATDNQKLTAIQMGYNLGPVALTVGVARNTDIGGVSGQDSDMIMTRLIGAF